MQQFSPRHDHSREPLMRRLDRVAGEINPFLLIVVVGLVILNLTCFVALTVSQLPITRIKPDPSISPSAMTIKVGPITPPGPEATRSGSSPRSARRSSMSP